MGKAIKSDGRVNAAILRASKQGFRSLAKEIEQKVKAALVDDSKLRQCRLFVLCLAQHAWIVAYDEPNWWIGKHICIKMQQSKNWRDFKAAHNLTGPTFDVGETDANDSRPINPGEEDNNDAFGCL